MKAITSDREPNCDASQHLLCRFVRVLLAEGFRIQGGIHSVVIPSADSIRDCEHVRTGEEGVLTSFVSLVRVGNHVNARVYFRVTNIRNTRSRQPISRRLA